MLNSATKKPCFVTEWKWFSNKKDEVAKDETQPGAQADVCRADGRGAAGFLNGGSGIGRRR